MAKIEKGKIANSPGNVELVLMEGDDTAKPVLYFKGKKSGLVLNKTNGRTIAAAYGPDSDMWVGKAIILYPTETDFGGKRVPCIRCKSPAPLPGQMTDEELPF